MKDLDALARDARARLDEHAQVAGAEAERERQALLRIQERVESLTAALCDKIAEHDGSSGLERWHTEAPLRVVLRASLLLRIQRYDVEPNPISREAQVLVVASRTSEGRWSSWTQHLCLDRNGTWYQAEQSPLVGHFRAGPLTNARADHKGNLCLNGRPLTAAAAEIAQSDRSCWVVSATAARYETHPAGAFARIDSWQFSQADFELSVGTSAARLVR